MADKYIKECSTSLVVREIQIKTRNRYYYTYTTMTIIQKERKKGSECWQGKRECLYTAHGDAKRFSRCGNSLLVLPKVKHDKMIPQFHFKIYCIPKELKLDIQISTCPCIFVAALFTKVKRQKQPQCPATDEWMNKLCLDTYEYSAIKIKQ